MSNKPSAVGNAEYALASFKRLKEITRELKDHIHNDYDSSNTVADESMLEIRKCVDLIYKAETSLRMALEPLKIL